MLANSIPGVGAPGYNGNGDDRGSAGTHSPYPRADRKEKIWIDLTHAKIREKTVSATTLSTKKTNTKK